MKKRYYNFILIFVLLCLYNTSRAQTVKDYRGGILRGTYTSIATAVWNAADGDSLLLSPHTFDTHSIPAGTDSRNLVFQGTISGTDTSTIDGQGLGVVLNFTNSNLTIRDIVITNGTSGIVTTNNGNQTIWLTGNTVVRNSYYIGVSQVGGILKIDKNVHVVNNGDILKGLGGIVAGSSNPIHVYISDSVLISGNRNMQAIGYVLNTGGGGISVSSSGHDTIAAYLTITGNVRIENNTSLRPGGALHIYGNTHINISGAQIINNQADTAAAIHVVQFPDSGTPRPAPYVNINNSRIYNPSPTGKRQNEVFAQSVSVIPDTFSTSGCWWGSNDTTGLITRQTGTIFNMPNWAITNWSVNNGLPVSWWSSFPVAAQFTLNTAAALPLGCFPYLQGSYTATMGTFTPPIATMQYSNIVSSTFKASSIGTANIRAIIDADTFQINQAVTSIDEIGFEQVKVYPNPASSELQISGAAVGSRALLYDIMGKVVGHYELSTANYTCSINQLPVGNYVLEITTKEGQKGTVKIVKR